MSAFERYGFTEKQISHFVLGNVLSDIQEKVVLAPCWLPETVGVSDREWISSEPVGVWNCKAGDKYFTFIITGVGAGICSDVVLSLKTTACKEILFIGSAGALSENIKIGDIFLPKSIFCGDGLCRYLQENIFEDIFGREIFLNMDIQNRIRTIAEDICVRQGIVCHVGKSISVETIYSQYRHIDTFLKMGCECLEMEGAAVVMSAQMIGRSCAAVFCISDNSICGQSLINIPEELINYRKSIRGKIFPELLNAYVNI